MTQVWKYNHIQDVENIFVNDKPVVYKEQLTEAQATIERQGRAIEALKVQRDSLARRIPDSELSQGNITRLRTIERYNARIETILNGEK